MADENEFFRPIRDFYQRSVVSCTADDDLVDIVARKRDWNEEQARKQLVTFFDAWGPKDAMTLYGRRRLSSVLFR